MSVPSASIRVLAQRLLVVETTTQSALDLPGQEVVRICEKLRHALTQFVGPDGFMALLRRAVALARAEVSSLETARVSAAGRLEGLEELAAGTPRDVEAAIAITTHVLQLLVTFIGESLTLRLMRDVWPGAFSQTKAEREDL